MKQTKFWITASAFVSAGAFLVFGYIGEDTWMKTVLAIVGVYSGSNILATVAHGRTDRE